MHTDREIAAYTEAFAAGAADGARDRRPGAMVLAVRLDQRCAAYCVSVPRDHYAIAVQAYRDGYHAAF